MSTTYRQKAPMNAGRETEKSQDRNRQALSLRRRWARFLLVMAVLAALIHLAPAVERLPKVGKQVSVLRESGINVGAWYYDDVEEYFEAEEYIRYKRQEHARIYGQRSGE
jgi:hypothetical protein